MRKLIALIALVATMFLTIALTDTHPTARPRGARRARVTRRYDDHGRHGRVTRRYRHRRRPVRRYVRPPVRYRYVYPRYRYDPWYGYRPGHGITFILRF